MSIPKSAVPAIGAAVIAAAVVYVAVVWYTARSERAMPPTVTASRGDQKQVDKRPGPKSPPGGTSPAPPITTKVPDTRLAMTPKPPVSKKPDARDIECVFPPSRASVVDLDSGINMGPLADVEVRSGKCYYIIHRSDGVLWARESARTRLEVEPQTPLESATARLPTQTTPSHLAPTSESAQPDRIFQQAYTEYRNAKFDAAIHRFQTFLRRFPEHELAENAQYFLAEAYLGLAENNTRAGEAAGATEALEDAVREFRKVVAHYPRGTKVAPTLYKEALVLLQLQQPDSARQRLQYLVENFAMAPEASLAQDRLRGLGQ